MKPIILTLMRTFRPGYRSGGPVVSLESLIQHLQDEYDIRIVTRDRDKGDTIPYTGVCYNEWIRMNEGWVRYLPAGWAHWQSLIRVLREEEYSLLYINDLLSPHWGIWPLLLRRVGLMKRQPLLIAPRGQLNSGALGIKSWKKNIFLRFAGFTRLFKGAVWHATNEKESEEIQRWVHDPEAVWIAPNLPSIHVNSIETESPGQTAETIRLIFLSRISPKKNLEYSLTILSKVDFPVEFDIFGPIDDVIYWEKLNDQIRLLPENVKVSYKGELLPTQVAETFRQYHAFLFPTLGENFGHVILESLASGCLPIISDRTPWMDLPDHSCGWVIPLEQPAGYLAALTVLHRMSLEEYSFRRSKATEYASAYLAESRAIEKNREMFGAMCDGGKTLKPEHNESC